VEQARERRDGERMEVKGRWKGGSREAGSRAAKDVRNNDAQQA
jgi:hypothetical protein